LETPPLKVSTTRFLTAEGSPAGLSQVTKEEFSNPKEAQIKSPILTEARSDALTPRFVPYMEISVPPSLGPLLGVISLIWGAAVACPDWEMKERGRRGKERQRKAKKGKERQGR